MNYLQFIQQKPILTGRITVNGKQKEGVFIPLWSRYSNSMVYHYHTPKGNKGSGGFTMMRAYSLLNNGILSIIEE